MVKNRLFLIKKIGICSCPTKWRVQMEQEAGIFRRPVRIVWPDVPAFLPPTLPDLEVWKSSFLVFLLLPSPTPLWFAFSQLLKGRRKGWHYVKYYSSLGRRKMREKEEEEEEEKEGCNFAPLEHLLEKPPPSLTPSLPYYSYIGTVLDSAVARNKKYIFVWENASFLKAFSCQPVFVAFFSCEIFFFTPFTAEHAIQFLLYTENKKNTNLPPAAASPNHQRWVCKMETLLEYVHIA